MKMDDDPRFYETGGNPEPEPVDRQADSAGQSHPHASRRILPVKRLPSALPGFLKKHWRALAVAAAGLLFIITLSLVLSVPDNGAGGYFHWLAEGMPGAKEGKLKGMSAEDTVARMEEVIPGNGELEVLVARVNVKNFHTVGDKDDPTYAALYLAKADAYFTVDLAEATFLEDTNGSIFIVLPYPKAELSVSQEDVEKVADYQKHYFSGSTEDGFREALNTYEKLTEASEDTIANYDTLMGQAKAAAARQIELLAQSICGRDTAVHVSFREEGGGS